MFFHSPKVSEGERPHPGGGPALIARMVVSADAPPDNTAGDDADLAEANQSSHLGRAGAAAVISASHKHQPAGVPPRRSNRGVRRRGSGESACDAERATPFHPVAVAAAAALPVGPEGRAGPPGQRPMTAVPEDIHMALRATTGNADQDTVETWGRPLSSVDGASARRRGASSGGGVGGGHREGVISRRDLSVQPRRGPPQRESTERSMHGVVPPASPAGSQLAEIMERAIQSGGGANQLAPHTAASFFSTRPSHWGRSGCGSVSELEELGEAPVNPQTGTGRHRAATSRRETPASAHGCGGAGSSGPPGSIPAALFERFHHDAMEVVVVEYSQKVESHNDEHQPNQPGAKGCSRVPSLSARAGSSRSSGAASDAGAIEMPMLIPSDSGSAGAAVRADDRSLVAYNGAPAGIGDERALTVALGASFVPAFESVVDESKREDSAEAAARRSRNILRLLNSPKMRAAINNLKRRSGLIYLACTVAYVTAIALVNVYIDIHVVNMRRTMSVGKRPSLRVQRSLLRWSWTSSLRGGGYWMRILRGSGARRSSSTGKTGLCPLCHIEREA